MGKNMIKIDIRPDHIGVTGHANTGPPGHDICCAAVSTLLQTLEASIRQLTFTIGQIWCIVKPIGGKERVEKYGAAWPKASLNETLDRFAPGAQGRLSLRNKSEQKICYDSLDGRYTVLWDMEGNYFRIQDNTIKSTRNYTDINGNNAMNVIENGKTRGRSKAEYQAATHFLNIDGQ